MTILTLKRKIYKVSELKNIRMFPGDPTGSPDDFSVSHHLIDCCKEVYYLSEKDFKDSQLNKEILK